MKEHLYSKKIMYSILVITTLLSVGINAYQQKTYAQGSIAETPYGGQNLFQITCTCSANTLIYILDYTTSNTLALVYQPGASTLYESQNIYGTYLLGTYQEGGGICEIVVGPTCVELTSDGQMGSAPGTGTSL